MGEKGLRSTTAASTSRQVVVRALVSADMSHEPVVPYDELDPPVVGLVRRLNELPGIETVSSCGGGEGHIEPPDRWSVGFQLGVEASHSPWPTPDAWISLEWLAWFTNGNLRRSSALEMELNSFPPYLNVPGRSIYFTITGTRGENGTEPDEFAESIERYASEYYVSADDAAAWDEDVEP